MKYRTSQKPSIRFGAPRRPFLMALWGLPARIFQTKSLDEETWTFPGLLRTGMRVRLRAVIRLHQRRGTGVITRHRIPTAKVHSAAQAGESRWTIGTAAGTIPSRAQRRTQYRVPRGTRNTRQDQTIVDETFIASLLEDPALSMKEIPTCWRDSLPCRHRR